MYSYVTERGQYEVSVRRGAYEQRRVTEPRIAAGPRTHQRCDKVAAGSAGTCRRQIALMDPILAPSPRSVSGARVIGASL